jgi:hypothetical protein
MAMKCRSCGVIFADPESWNAHYPCELCAHCWLPVSDCVQVRSQKYHPQCYATVKEKEHEVNRRYTLPRF